MAATAIGVWMYVWIPVSRFGQKLNSLNVDVNQHMTWDVCLYLLYAVSDIILAHFQTNFNYSGKDANLQ